MKRRSLLIGAILGGITSLPVVGLMYLGERALGLPFVPFDIFDWMTRALPGNVLTFGIDLMVTIITVLPLGETSSAAKLAEQIIAILQLVGGGVVFGLALAYFSKDKKLVAPIYGLMGGLILLSVTLMIE
ncbi:MAG: molybdopterin-binding oxidoreductase, partial [Chloroflexi bacterium]|nr:molybdopterin-binding oxidoreductase [Chloroflexota bacterium]